MHSTPVREAMHPGILACTPAATLPEVAQLMATCQVHCVAVVESRKHAPLGVISALDVARVLAEPVSPAVASERRPS